MLTLLRNYSIINFDKNTKLEYKNQIVRIHSLTQCFLESNQTPKDISNQLKEIANIFIKDLKDCESKELQDGKYWLNHFYKIYEYKEKKQLFLENFLGDLSLISNLFKTKGIPYKALEVIRYCYEKSLYMNLHIKAELANCLCDMMQLDEACKLYREVEQANLKKLGSTHPNYLTTKNNLASCLQKMNQLVEACKLYREVEQAELEVLGPTHPHYLITKNNLALCLQEMKQLDEACKLFREVEQAKLEVLGSTHPSYLITKNNLAVCIQRMDQLDD